MLLYFEVTFISVLEQGLTSLAKQVAKNAEQIKNTVKASPSPV
jgi:hypothetical protein